MSTWYTQKFCLFKQMTFSASVYQIRATLLHFITIVLAHIKKRTQNTHTHTHSPNQTHPNLASKQLQWDSSVIIINTGVRATDKPVECCTFQLLCIYIFSSKLKSVFLMTLVKTMSSVPWDLMSEFDCVFEFVSTGIERFAENRRTPPGGAAVKY